MKKIFFVGDFKSNTGPAIANKKIKKLLKNTARFSICHNKFFRIVEMIYKIIISNRVCFCSFSKINFYGIIICKILKKKSFYLMHGYCRVEQKFNHTINYNSIKLEKYILNNVDLVICVSKKYMNFVKQYEKQANFDYCLLGIDYEKYCDKKDIVKNNNQIMSTGGTVPLKNNLIICEAISKNIDKFTGIKYIICGPNYYKNDILKKYKFVKFYNNISHNDCINKMKESSLYIQNSYIESFGLSVIEALSVGCNILVAKNVGSLECFTNLEKNDIIFKNDDLNEIANKIEYNLKNNNNERLLNSIDIEKLSSTYCINQLVTKIMSY